MKRRFGKKKRIISWELKIEWEHLFKMFFLVIYMEKLYRWASKENETKNSRIAHNKLIVTAIYSATGAQAHNARRYIIFFLLLCERSAKRDMWHILLHNKRIWLCETWLSPRSIWRCCVTTVWIYKVCMETQRFCRKSQCCLYFVNKIYLPGVFVL